MSDPGTATGQIAASGVAGIDERATVTQVAQKMAELGVDAIPVFDQEGKMTGTLTVRDIIRMVAAGRGASTTTVDELGDGPPVAVAPTAGIDEIARTMVAHHVRRLPVVVGDRVVGVVSTDSQDRVINLSAVMPRIPPLAGPSMTWPADLAWGAAVPGDVATSLAPEDRLDAVDTGSTPVLPAGRGAVLGASADVRPPIAAPTAGGADRLKVGEVGVETPTVTDARTPGQEPPGLAPRTAPEGAMIPLRTKKQVARRDGLRARMDEDLARRKGAQRQPQQS